MSFVCYLQNKRNYHIYDWLVYIYPNTVFETGLSVPETLSFVVVYKLYIVWS